MAIFYIVASPTMTVNKSQKQFRKDWSQNNIRYILKIELTASCVWGAFNALCGDAGVLSMVMRATQYFIVPPLSHFVVGNVYITPLLFSHNPSTIFIYVLTVCTVCNFLGTEE